MATSLIARCSCRAERNSARCTGRRFFPARQPGSAGPNSARGPTPLRIVALYLAEPLLRFRQADGFCVESIRADPHGLPRVQAICDWVHHNIEYRFGSGRPDLSASEVIERRHGVCRDFAHAAIALCRAFNLPARYVTGHLPDVGYVDPGTPMDFHAYCEVYLGQEWLTFDARFNVSPHWSCKSRPRCGRRGWRVCDDLRRGQPHPF